MWIGFPGEDCGSSLIIVSDSSGEIYMDALDLLIDKAPRSLASQEAPMGLVGRILIALGIVCCKSCMRNPREVN